MGIKGDLAMLHSNMSLDKESFIKLPAFVNIEKEVDLIKEVEKEHLPEITKVICCSDNLLGKEWAKKYDKIKEKCQKPQNVDAKKDLKKEFYDEQKFKRFLIDFEYSPLLEMYKKIFDDARDEINKLWEEVRDCEEIINDNERKLEEEKLSDKNIQILNQEIDKQKSQKDSLKKVISGKMKYVKQYDNHIKMLDNWEKKNKDKESESRSKLYCIAGEKQEYDEENFILSYIKNGKADSIFKEKLREKNFKVKMLQILKQEQYRMYIFPVLTKLYGEGWLDLEEPIFKDFIMFHSVELSEYLKSMEKTELLGDNMGILLEYCIEKQICDDKCDVFTALWNKFTDKEEWKYLLNQMKKMKIGNLSYCVSKIIGGMRGRAAQSLLEAIDETEGNNIAVIDICNDVLKDNCLEYKDFIMAEMKYLNKKEKNNCKTIRTYKRQIDAQSQNLFSVIYKPVEELEELAVDLKNTSRNISCGLIAAKMQEILGDLRSGLTAVNVDPVEDYRKWKNQSFVDFDAEKHKTLLRLDEKERKVKLKTMGFKYIDEDGDQQKLAANVYVEEKIKREKKVPSKKNTTIKNKTNVGSKSGRVGKKGKK